MENLEERINDAIDDLDIQIKAATQRQDVEMCKYLNSKKQGLGMVLEFMEDKE